MARVKKHITGHTCRVCVVRFSPDGQYIASGSSDNKIYVWKCNKGLLESDVKLKLCFTFDVGMVVLTLDFSHDSSSIVSGSLLTGSQPATSTHLIHVWGLTDDGNNQNSINDGECKQKLAGHTSHVFSVCFSPDDMHIVSGSADNTIRIWSVKTGKCTGEIRGHSKPVTSVQSFAADNKFRFVSGSLDETIRVWGQ